MDTVQCMACLLSPSVSIPTEAAENLKSEYSSGHKVSPHHMPLPPLLRSLCGDRTPSSLDNPCYPSSGWKKRALTKEDRMGSLLWQKGAFNIPVHLQTIKHNNHHIWCETQIVRPPAQNWTRKMNLELNPSLFCSHSNLQFETCKKFADFLPQNISITFL